MCVDKNGRQQTWVRKSRWYVIMHSLSGPVISISNLVRVEGGLSRRMNAERARLTRRETEVGWLESGLRSKARAASRTDNVFSVR